MRFRVLAFVGIMFVTGHALAQTTPQTPRTPATPVPPAPGAALPAPPPLPPPAPAPPAARKEGQPVNIRVELTITEEGGTAPASKKTVTAVVGDSHNGYVREQGVSTNPTAPGGGGLERIIAPLNLDAWPTIMTNGKIRLVCTIQYSSNQRPAQDRQINTDIRQNLTLILESGKKLTISEATDPISDRRTTVEVMATILK